MNRPLARVLLVTGAYPPDICGVGDYTHRLMSAAPPDWDLFVARDWSIRSAPRIIRSLLSRKPEAIIMQYPTQGYGWSLVPHLLVLVGRLTGRFRTVLALHEFTSLSRKARLALAFASHAAHRIVFTTEVERDRALASALFSRRVPTSVIGILSNIPAAAHLREFGERAIDFAYFGHIRPNKGLETFVSVMTELQERAGAFRIAIIGEVPEGYEEFAAAILARSREAGIEPILGLDDQAVAEALANVRILYLPFEDGVSARRGSVLAGFSNRVLVATRIGEATPPSLRDAVIPCEGISSDVPILVEARQLADSEAAVRHRSGLAYIEKMLPRDWRHVASLYEKAIDMDLRQ